MSGASPPPSPPDTSASKPSDSGALSETSKKKSRLQWDEDNLISNAQEMERAGPRMKIDEPKTPYVASEAGSSTSGSAHQSPPESPFFMPGEELHGFGTLEDSMRGASSDGASSAGSAGRSVHIDEGAFSSGGSSPRSKEIFAARRKAHYRNEARPSVDAQLGKEDETPDENVNGGRPNGRADPNGVVHPSEGDPEETTTLTSGRVAAVNGHQGNGVAEDVGQPKAADADGG